MLRQASVKPWAHHFRYVNVSRRGYIRYGLYQCAICERKRRVTDGIDNATVLSWLSVSGSLDNTETTDSLSWSFNSGAQAFDALDAGDSLVPTLYLH